MPKTGRQSRLDLLNETIRNANLVHRLATESANAFNQLRFNKACVGNTAQHDWAVLERVKGIVAETPEMPLREDLFRGETWVEIGGSQGTSTHTALLTLASRVWRMAHISKLEPDDRSREETDASGITVHHVISRHRLIPPTELTWTPEAWQAFSERFQEILEANFDGIESRLAIECQTAEERIERRFDVRLSPNEIWFDPSRWSPEEQGESEFAEPGKSDEAGKATAAELDAGKKGEGELPLLEKTPAKLDGGMNRSDNLTPEPRRDEGKTLAQRRFRGVSLDEAEIRVREWLATNAKENPGSITRDAVSKGTDVSAGQVSNTSAWKVFAARKKAKSKPGPRNVPLTERMEVVIPSDCERPDELAELIEEQEKEKAEDERRKKRRHGRS